MTNHAVVGQTQVNSYAAAIADIPGSGAKFALWSPWSQNDGRSAADIQGDYDANVANFIALCHANEIVPIIVTIIPTVNITNSTDDAARLSVNTQVKALAASDVIVADLAASGIGNGANPERLIGTYTVDGVHPNVAGTAVLKPVLQSAIQAYLSLH